MGCSYCILKFTNVLMADFKQIYMHFILLISLLLKTNFCILPIAIAIAILVDLGTGSGVSFLQLPEQIGSSWEASPLILLCKVEWCHVQLPPNLVARSSIWERNSRSHIFPILSSLYPPPCYCIRDTVLPGSESVHNLTLCMTCLPPLHPVCIDIILYEHACTHKQPTTHTCPFSILLGVPKWSGGTFQN